MKDLIEFILANWFFAMFFFVIGGLTVAMSYVFVIRWIKKLANSDKEEYRQFREFYRSMKDRDY